MQNVESNYLGVKTNLLRMSFALSSMQGVWFSNLNLQECIELDVMVYVRNNHFRNGESLQCEAESQTLKRK